MRNRKFQSLKWTAVLGACVLAACGGGGNGTPAAPPATLQLTGVAATGAAMAGAPVAVTCASGPNASTTTAADGSYALSLSGGQTLPCLLQASSGAVTLHSLVTTAGRANITPLTELVTAHAAGMAPASAFANFAPAAAATAAAADIAIGYVGAQLVALGLTSSAFDPVTVNFSVGDANDKILDALAAKLAGAKVTLAQLTTAAAQRTAVLSAIPALAGGAPGNGAGALVLNGTNFPAFDAAQCGAPTVFTFNGVTTKSYKNCGPSAIQDFKVIVPNDYVQGALKPSARCEVSKTGGTLTFTSGALSFTGVMDAQANDTVDTTSMGVAGGGQRLEKINAWTSDGAGGIDQILVGFGGLDGSWIDVRVYDGNASGGIVIWECSLDPFNFPYTYPAQ